jgi:hypothetical protein
MHVKVTPLGIAEVDLQVLCSQVVALLVAEGMRSLNGRSFPGDFPGDTREWHIAYGCQNCSMIEKLIISSNPLCEGKSFESSLKLH